MFSYLDIAKKLTNESIVSRGLRYYLEGRVLSNRELVLDFWREYSVYGQKEYIVKLPLLHLALDKSKFGQAAEALDEVVSCSCEYFGTVGVCKHIVAICVSLDQEFGFNNSANNAETIIQAQKNQEVPQTANLLDSIFEAETTRLARQIDAKLDMFWTNSRPSDLGFWEDFVLLAAKDPKLYSAFLERIKKDCLNKAKDYDQEPKLIVLIFSSLKFGSKFWWNFWQGVYAELSPKRQLLLLTEIYENYALGLKCEFADEFLGILTNLSQENKQEILDSLQNSQVLGLRWVQFALDSKHYSWLEKNLASLDAQTLLQIALIWPEKVEEIENYLSDQVRLLSDYLGPKTSHNELVEIVSSWRSLLGGSQIFNETMEYVQTSHKRRRSLLAALKGGK